MGINTQNILRPFRDSVLANRVSINIIETSAGLASFLRQVRAVQSC
jgi:hypothetical protein